MKNMKFITVPVAALILFCLSPNGWARTPGSISTANHQQRDFPKMAQIQASQAIKIATEKVPGDVISVALENEDGFLVYAVEIINSPTGLHELNIDAGNGKILVDEVKNHAQKEHEEDEGEEEND